LKRKKQTNKQTTTIDSVFSFVCSISVDTSNQNPSRTSYIDDGHASLPVDGIYIKLQSDADGRYGFNVKVLMMIIRSCSSH
jgi:hypothetical protein